MTTAIRQLLRMLALIATLSLIAAACGSDSEADTAEAGSETPEGEDTDDAMEEGSDVTGEIFISGSSTVEPVSVRVAELFEEVAPDVFVDVEGPGTGDGFQKFCAGETDISGASRAIKDEEAADCAAAGIEFTEILVGIDGIGVMTNNANDAVDCVTFENLYGLVGPESNGVDSWAGANDIAGEGMPDAPLDIFGPGAESGTYDSFIEIVLEDIADERGQEATTREDYNPSAEDNIILQGIESSDTSLGWVGFAFASNADVKLLEVDGGDGCVAATAETIASNEYPISRNLYIYVNNAKADDSEALRSFVDFYTTDGLSTAVAEVGYVPLTADSMAATQAAWAARSAGSAAGGGEEAPAEEESAAADVAGEVFISGSSTVEPVSVRVAELFEEVAPDVFVDVEGPGTGDGFQKFCAGETDISGASRAIKDEEAADCAAAGIEFTEILVGIDGIGVMTNNANTAVDCVTFENLYGLVGPESNGVDSWAGANDIAGEGMPDAPLDIFGPGAESGTFDSFIEIVLEDIADERGQEATTREDYNPSAEDNIILQGIESSDTSLGWVGFAFASNADVKLLEVDGGDGCVEANADTIASNEYPISRNLYIYVNNAKAAESPALQAFVDFYVTDGLDTAVAEVGYVPLTEDSKSEVRAAWNG